MLTLSLIFYYSLFDVLHYLYKFKFETRLIVPSSDHTLKHNRRNRHKPSNIFSFVHSEQFYSFSVKIKLLKFFILFHFNVHKLYLNMHSSRFKVLINSKQFETHQLKFIFDSHLLIYVLLSQSFSKIFSFQRYR